MLNSIIVARPRRPLRDHRNAAGAPIAHGDGEALVLKMKSAVDLGAAELVIR